MNFVKAMVPISVIINDSEVNNINYNKKIFKYLLKILNKLFW